MLYRHVVKTSFRYALGVYIKLEKENFIIETVLKLKSQNGVIVCLDLKKKTLCNCRRSWKLQYSIYTINIYVSKQIFQKPCKHKKSVGRTHTDGTIQFSKHSFANVMLFGFRNSAVHYCLMNNKPSYHILFYFYSKWVFITSP